MGDLSSAEIVGDEVAREALREFLTTVLELEGPDEVRRLAEVCRCQLETEYPETAKAVAL